MPVYVGAPDNAMIKTSPRADAPIGGVNPPVSLWCAVAADPYRDLHD
ncbi:hypothetical protein QQG74_25190 [Micromonospora sp. FIMYZ51]